METVLARLKTAVAIVATGGALRIELAKLMFWLFIAVMLAVAIYETLRLKKNNPLPSNVLIFRQKHSKGYGLNVKKVIE